MMISAVKIRIDRFSCIDLLALLTLTLAFGFGLAISSG
jgi:hypothetical protein